MIINNPTCTWMMSMVNWGLGQLIVEFSFQGYCLKALGNAAKPRSECMSSCLSVKGFLLINKEKLLSEAKTLNI